MNSQIKDFRLYKKQKNHLKLYQKNRQSEKIDIIQNKIFSIVAHDLKSPLASIKGFSELMLKELSGPLNTEQREFLSIIKSLSTESIQMVNDLLDISVIESGNLCLILRSESLYDLLEERIKIHQVIANKKNVNILLYKSETPNIMIDKSRMKQVIDNLFGNAIKYSSNDSKIYVNIYKQRDHINFSIKDQGIGISETDINNIFEEYKSFNKIKSEEKTSTGLGLAISKRIVEAHNGTITVLSKVGEGSEFIISLPL